MTDEGPIDPLGLEMSKLKLKMFLLEHMIMRGTALSESFRLRRTIPSVLSTMEGAMEEYARFLEREVLPKEKLPDAERAHLQDEFREMLEEMKRHLRTCLPEITGG